MAFMTESGAAMMDGVLGFALCDKACRAELRSLLRLDAEGRIHNGGGMRGHEHLRGEVACRWSRVPQP